MKAKVLAAAVAGVMLAGCTSDNVLHNSAGTFNWGDPDVYADLEKAARSGNAFTAALANGYQDLSAFEKAQADWRDHERFARKGLLAAQGNMVDPELPERWDLIKTNWAERIDGTTYGDIYKLRETMMHRFHVCDSRTKMPEESAAAQLAYDCWIEELEEGWEAPRISACKARFMENLARIEKACGPAPMPKPVAVMKSFDVFFDFDSSALTAAAKGVIADAAAFAGKDGTVKLMGWADTSGNKAYNMALSRKRLASVAKGLAAAGLRSGAVVSQSAMGETKLPVGTADNVKESMNRLVRIEAQGWRMP